MIQLSNKKDCCGCFACVQRCPKQCISFKEDNEGFLYPVVDKDRCIDCGLCEKVCPVLHQNESRKPLKVYAAINKNEDIRRLSSSGGVFTLLAEKIIDEGGDRGKGGLHEEDGIKFAKMLEDAGVDMIQVAQANHTGNMADTNKAFSFEVSLSSGSLPSSATITNGGSDYSVADDKATFSLADGQSITINGIPIDVVATITEVGCDGYKVSATENGSSIVVSNDIVNNKQTATMQVKTVTDGLKVVVVNDNTDIVDTGVLLDSMPYVLILAAAIAGAAFYFIRKKKDDEDDLD